MNTGYLWGAMFVLLLLSAHRDVRAFREATPGARKVEAFNVIVDCITAPLMLFLCISEFV